MRVDVGHLSGALIFGLLGFLACSAPEETKYGVPYTIDRMRPPPSTAGVAGTPGTPAGTPGTPAGDGGATTGNPKPAGACVEAGFVGDMNCAVKWSTGIFPKMQTTGIWKCSLTGACHDPAATTKTPPVFATTEAKETWNALRAHKNASSIPYINPCSKNVAESYFVGNLKGTSGKIMPEGTQATQADVAEVETWVKCGAPNN